MLIKLPYPPSFNDAWKPRRRGGLYKSGVAVTWQTHAAWQVKAVMGARKPLEGPVALKVIAHRPDKRNRDADNLIKLLQDALQEGGLVANDSQFRTAIRWADDPWEWSLGGIGYVQFPHMVTVELGEPK